MKFINKYKKTVGKYLNWLEFQIPAFWAFCKTDYNTELINCKEHPTNVYILTLGTRPKEATRLLF